MSTVLLVETGPASFKRSYFEQVLNGPGSILLLKNSAVSGGENDWYRDYLAQAEVLKANFRRPREMMQAVSGFLQQSRIKLAGVFTYQEEAVPTAQTLAKKLFLPVITSGETRALRNKWHMRAAFRSQGLWQPKTVLCSSPAKLGQAAKSIGFPCVLKPVEMLASMGVRKLERYNARQINAAYRLAANVDIPEEDLKFAFNISSGVMLEEYVPARQEISVEGFVVAGRFYPLAFTKKYLGPEPEFHEMGHATPFSLPQDLERQVLQTVECGVRGLALQNTAIHAELRLSPNRRPVLIEIAARLAGDFIPLLVEKSSGVNMVQAAIQVAQGVTPDFVVETRGTYGIQFLRNADLAALRRKITSKNVGLEELVSYAGEAEGRHGHVVWKGKDVLDIERVRRQLMGPPL